MMDLPTRIDFNLKTKAAYQLREYLLAHEQHILWETNDYGDLYDVFLHYIGREPEDKR